MMSSESTLKAPIFAVLLLLLTSMSPLALGDNSESFEVREEPTIIVPNLPSLICENGESCPTPDRGVGPWLSYSPDRDHNGMDDRLQRILDGEYESVSTTAIEGPDGRLTVAIHVDYSQSPGPEEIDELKSTLAAHGWIEEGAWFDVLRSIDTISVDHVPLSALLPIWRLEGVVTVEQQNVMIPFLDWSVPAMKVSNSPGYQYSMRALGHRGDGVVVAVLDTGVDNEHRSLNDFDDLNDDPDLDATSYTDQKWVAGYDATSAFSNTEGEDDPDDSNGHGTHVAGTVLGSGSSDRQFIGVAPGSYLVDIKVLTDAGGTNAQNTLRGLQWAIDNVDTDWGNNGSSNGIDILSMSYGSVTNPQSDDPGDNGTSAESTLVNQASADGLICVIAMGNDGIRRVPSPASADTSIAIGAIDERDSFERADDEIADYSNWGPREENGDGDASNELKPDVVAPGTGINAPLYVGGSTQLPGSPRPTAENSYQELDGTSMATPHVSGLIAIMLGMDEDLDLDDVRQLLRENSEVRGNPYDSSIDPVWNEKYGFGIVDGSALQNEIGNGDPAGPTNNTTASGCPNLENCDWVNIETPENSSWIIVDETYRIRGNVTPPPSVSVEEVNIRAWFWHQPSGQNEWVQQPVFDWRTASGKEEWTLNFDVEDWRDYGQYGKEIFFEVKALMDNQIWSNTTSVQLRQGAQELNLLEPSGQSAISGMTEISGTFLTPEHNMVEWRIDRGEWQEHAVSRPDYTTASWSLNWDSTEVDDGMHQIAIRGVDKSLVITDEIRKSIEVDNYPPAPALSVFGSISVEEYGIPVEDAFVNTFLEVRADIRNNGDADAEEVVVHLREQGTKRSEATIPLIEPGQVVEVVLYWNPMASGGQELEVIIDPGQVIAETDRLDNSETITFPVQPRPDGVDLAIRPGAVTTSPAIPRPNEPYTISIRVDNLGARDSQQFSVELSMMNEFGYELYGVFNGTVIIGQMSSSINFAGNISDARGISYRATIITSSDLVSDNNAADFVVVQDYVTLSGARTPALQSAHNIIASAGLGEDSLLFTSVGSKVFVHRMAVDQSLYTCLELEDEWIGDIAVNSYQGIVSVVWTRTYLDENSFIRSTVSYTTIDHTCQMTPRQDKMPGLLSAEGTYWGLGLDQKDDNVVIAGYHRDMVTGGTYQDLTSIFLIDTESPLSASPEDWEIRRNIVLDINMYPRSAPPIQVEIGKKDIHILHQNLRDDSTGVERLGMFYAHGNVDEQNWAFDVAAGDDATYGKMVLVENKDGTETIFTAWREGSDADAKLITRISPPSWIDGTKISTPARGLSNIALIETDRGVQILYDAISPTGPKLHYGLLSNFSGGEDMWLSDRITSGVLITAWRTDDSGELHFTYVTSNGLRVRKMVEDPVAENPDHGLLDEIRLWLNLDESTFRALMNSVLITFCSLSLFVTFVVTSNRRRNKSPSSHTEFVNENWVNLDLSDSGDDIEITPIVSIEDDDDSLNDNTVVQETPPPEIAVVLESESEEVDPNSNRATRTSRRERRAVEAEMKQVMEEMHKALEESGMPPLPAPGELPPLPAPGELPPLPAPGELPPLPAPGELPPLPAPGELPPLPDLPAPEIPVTCGSCESTFNARANKARRVKCPLCGETVRL